MGTCLGNVLCVSEHISPLSAIPGGGGGRHDHVVTTGTLSPENSILLREDAEVKCRALVQPYTLPLGNRARQRGMQGSWMLPRAKPLPPKSPSSYSR